MKKIDSGRVETVIAFAILVAVVALFVKFYQPASEAALPAPSHIEAPATGTTTHN